MIKANLTPYTYRIADTDEHVMSISLPLKVNNIIEGVVRYTVSLDAIDNAILKLMSWLILCRCIYTYYCYTNKFKIC